MVSKLVFCIGQKARKYPKLCCEIVTRGHSIENHSNNHKWNFAFSGYSRFFREIVETQEIIADITGQTPRFFRAPFGIRNPMLEPVLAELGLQLTSWTRRGFDTREIRPDKVFDRLTKGLDDGDILLLHDGNSAYDNNGYAVVLSVLPNLLSYLSELGFRSISLPEA